MGVASGGQHEVLLLLPKYVCVAISSYCRKLILSRLGWKPLFSDRAMKEQQRAACNTGTRRFGSSVRFGQTCDRNQLSAAAEDISRIPRILSDDISSVQLLPPNWTCAFSSRFLVGEASV